MIQPWSIACMQMPPASLQNANNLDDAKIVINKSIDQAAKETAQAVALGVKDLVLFPEFVFTGGSGPNLLGVLDFPGAELERLQEIAQSNKIFVAANLYTKNPRYPGRYLNTSFILDRSGDVVLKSYRLHTYHSNSPHDFWDTFLDQEGIEGVYPVANTELGNLAIVPSMELIYPEVTRMFVLRGAEVMLHTTNERIVDLCIKRARAIENMIFLASCNSSVQRGSDPNMRVGSVVVDWRGHVLDELDQGTFSQCTATLDVEALRRRRAELDLDYHHFGPNYLARLRTELFKDLYSSVSIYPPNTYREGATEPTRVDPASVASNLALGRRNMAKHGLLPDDFAGGITH